MGGDDAWGVGSSEEVGSSQVRFMRKENKKIENGNMELQTLKPKPADGMPKAWFIKAGQEDIRADGPTKAWPDGKESITFLLERANIKNPVMNVAIDYKPQIKDADAETLLTAFSTNSPEEGSYGDYPGNPKKAPREVEHKIAELLLALVL